MDILALIGLVAVARWAPRAVHWYRENSTGGSLFTTQQGYGPK